MSPTPRLGRRPRDPRPFGRASAPGTVRGLAFALALGLALGHAAAAPLPAAAAPPVGTDPLAAVLTPRLQQALTALGERAQHVGVSVARLSTGATLFGHQAERAFNPASGTKLITAAVALQRLGPAYRFRTEVRVDALGDTSVRGNLYFRGFGDPSLTRMALLRIADRIADRGVRTIEGQVVVDDTAFADPQLPPGFEQKTADAAYRPTAGAVSVNANAAAVEVTPGARVGDPARVRLPVAAAAFTVDNKATTVAGRRAALQVTFGAAGQRTSVAVSGTIGLTARPQRVERRVAHAGLFAAHAFAEALAARGIATPRGAVVGRAPEKSRLLFTWQSEPLAPIVAAFVKQSDNFAAEQILKVLGGEVGGWPATWANAQQVVRGDLAALGVRAPPTPRFLNGSGLYDATRVSPNHVVALLRAALSDPRIGPEFGAALAIAGRDGTLKSRLADAATAGRVRGKTGTLDGVSSLSGIVPRPDGETLLFSVLCAWPGSAKAAPYRRLQDRIVRILAAPDGGDTPPPGEAAADAEPTADQAD